MASIMLTAEATPLPAMSKAVPWSTDVRKIGIPQVMEMVRLTLKLDRVPRPDDAADALALAICHGYNSSSKLNGINRPIAARRTGGK